jgi:hypothetical protein
MTRCVKRKLEKYHRDRKSFEMVKVKVTSKLNKFGSSYKPSSEDFLHQRKFDMKQWFELIKTVKNK